MCTYSSPNKEGGFKLNKGAIVLNTIAVYFQSQDNGPLFPNNNIV